MPCKPNTVPLCHYALQCSTSFFSIAPSSARSLTITRVFQNGVELNWLPPTEPNGEVHYVMEYVRDNNGSWTSVNTTSDSTHYSLTGLHSGTNYTVRVVAVNSAQRVDGIPLRFHFTPFSAAVNTAAVNTVEVVAGVLVSVLLLLVLLIAGVVIGMVIWRRVCRTQALGKASKKTAEQQNENMAVQTPEVAGESIEEKDCTNDHTYDYVIKAGSTIGRGPLYQELNVETQDYVSVYEQLRRGTYQELDCQGREAEHQYQKVNTKKKGYETRK